MANEINAPKSALTAARRVITLTDDLGRERAGVEEVLANRAGTRFYHWHGWYHDAKTRSSGRCRAITREEALALAEEIGR